MPGERKVKVYATPIDDSHRTLSEWMSLRGMRVEAVVNDGRSQFLEQHLNVSGEWDHYEKALLHGYKTGDASVTRKARQRLQQLKEGPPFLLWVHYFGPHDAPRAKHGSPRYGESPSDLYDHKIRVTDAHVGRLLADIERLERPTAVILTSDHGEEFLSDHRGHGANLKDVNVRVPLVVRGPGFQPGSSATVASLVDVLPTILRWTDVSPPRASMGVLCKSSRAKSHPSRASCSARPGASIVPARFNTTASRQWTTSTNSRWTSSTSPPNSAASPRAASSKARTSSSRSSDPPSRRPSRAIWSRIDA